MSGGGARSDRDVLRHMLTLATGAGVGKLVGIAAIPLITRLYGPEAYGLFSLLLAGTTLASPFVTLRYVSAILLPRQAGQAQALVLACFGLLVLSCTLMGVGFALWGDTLFGAVGAARLGDVWPLLLGSIALAGSHEILSAWASRHKRFRQIALAEVGMSVSGSTAKVLIQAATPLSGGLLIGHLVGQAWGCVALGRAWWGELRARGTATAWRQAARWRRMGALLRRHADFPRYRAPAQVLLVVSSQSPVFFAAALWGADVAGQLGLAFTVLAMPVSLLVQTTAQAYYAEIARIGPGDPARLHALSVGIARKLALLGAVPSLVLLVGAPTLFPWVFGARWADAGVFAATLSVYLVAQFVSNPLTQALNVLGRQRLFLWFDGVRAALTLGAFGVGVALDLTPFFTLGLYSAGLAAYYGLNAWTVLRLIRQRLPRQL